MTIEERMERLERENGRFKRGMAWMVMAGMALLIMGQALPPKVHNVVKARRFQVVRYDGELTVDIATGERGNGIIETYRPKGHKLVTIDSKVGQGFIRTYSSTGMRLVTIAGGVRGHGLINISDSSGNILISIGEHDRDGKGRVLQYDSEGMQKALWPPLR
jgi:hypothetical protein